MGDKAYVALLVDLDGTLIGRNELISPAVSGAVTKTLSRLHVSIASGREPADVIRFARELGLTAPQISDNGASLVDPDTGGEVWSAPMEPEYAEQIVAEFRRQGLTFIATYPGGKFTEMHPIDDWNLTRISALDLEEQRANEVVAHFTALPGLHVVKTFLPYNGMWAVDLTRAGVNKATAARRLADMLGIDTGRIIAAGDSYNDVPLLQECGLAIAMGDAPDELKAIAHYVAPSVDDDGLAVAIEEFVLPRT